MTAMILCIIPRGEPRARVDASSGHTHVINKPASEPLRWVNLILVTIENSSIYKRQVDKKYYCFFLLLVSVGLDWSVLGAMCTWRRRRCVPSSQVLVGEAMESTRNLHVLNAPVHGTLMGLWRFDLIQIRQLARVDSLIIAALLWAFY